jgi:hypothetical protein
MALFRRNLFFGVLTMVLTACGVHGQLREGVSQLRRPIEPVAVTVELPTDVEDELRLMSEQAGIIFAGQVLAIHWISPSVVGAGWVDVEFSVEQAVRGCAGQERYVLREWAGLWAGGVQRYRVGQRLLMLLHAPSASGLSSPVGGQDGAIPIAGMGVAPKAGDDSTSAGDQAVDLRWLETRVERTASTGRKYHGKPAAPVDPVVVRREMSQGVSGVRGNERFESGMTPIATGFQGTVNQGISPASSRGITLGGVLGLLGAWEAQKANAAR